MAHYESQGDQWQSNRPPDAVGDPGMFLGLPVRYDVQFEVQTEDGPVSGRAVHVLTQARVPEPGTVALVGVGLALIFGPRARRRD